MEIFIMLFGLCIIYGVAAMIEVFAGLTMRWILHQAGPYVAFLSIFSLALFTMPELPNSLGRRMLMTILYTWAGTGFLINIMAAVDSYILRKKGWWPKSTMVFSSLTGSIYFYLLIGGTLYFAGIVE